MIIVVSGKAMIRPIKPSKAPQIDSERSNMAGFSFIAFPMMRGVTMRSMIICTMAKTATADARITQKFCPVSTAFSRARNTVGMSAKV